MAKQKILLGMSGGVDSAVAAFLLQQQGYEVIGCTLTFSHDLGKSCLVEDAAQVAHQLGMEYITLDANAIFEEKVIQYFIQEYVGGRTPNPCAQCNILKFGLMLDYAQEHGFSLVASGHYAIMEEGKLFVAANHEKDQSYFLSRLPREMLSRIRFPLGEIPSKDVVRSIADEHQLHVAQKKDSQDICFIASNYRDYLRERGVQGKPGPVVDQQGNVIAEHDGLYQFTIGQRSRFPGLLQRMYVREINAEHNRIVLGALDDLWSNHCTISQLRYLVSSAEIGDDLWIKIRYNDQLFAGTLEPTCENHAKIRFNEPVHAITPGQLAAIYVRNGDRYQVVASGWIDK